jgi:hypothetical protein
MPFREKTVAPVPERRNGFLCDEGTPLPLPEKSEPGRGPMFCPAAKTHSCRESPFTTLSIAFRSP